MKSNNLNIKQEAFCQAYIRLSDATAAYKEAGYSHKTKTPKSVNEAACRLLKSSNVSARVKELQDKVAVIAEEKFNITTEIMLRHLDILRKSRIDEYVEYIQFDFPITTTVTTGKGKTSVTTTTTVIENRTELRFKTFDKLTENQLMCIESIKKNNRGEIELKLHGKEWSIEKINKHIGFYEKDNEQKSSITFESIEDREKRIEQLLEKLKK
jgi:phage terminase small subunit